jgi:pimeloyl-ACP methyl ester carboxylesterase
LAAQFPPTGKLVDIGGRRIHLDCRGAGSPTVIFESGLGPEGALSWANIHDQVATKTRACAYSRAGILWSDPDPETRRGDAVARDLHAALEKAGERPPFVLVGHSLGGPYAMIYTKYFGQDVAGVVFEDASHPDQVKRQTIIAGHSPAMPGIMQEAVFWASRLGIARMTQSARNIPASPFATKVVAAYWPSSIEAVLQETAILEATLAEAGTLRDLGTRPIFVLTADRPLSEQQIRQGRITHEQAAALQALWRTMQDEIAAWSSESEHHVLPDASHFIHWSHPNVVIAAIDAVVDRVRAAHASSSPNSN